MFEVEEIFQSLRELRKGEGLTVAKLHETDRFAEIFGEGSAAKAFDNLRSVADQLNASPSVIAARNALAIGVPVRRNTTARRVALLMEQDDIFGTNQRTLLRTEDTGLRELAIALYSQQPGANKIEEESLDLDSEIPDNPTEPPTEDDSGELGVVWEMLLRLTQRLTVLEKEVELVHLTREVRSDMAEDEAFQKAARSFSKAVDERTGDLEVIKQEIDKVIVEARRISGQKVPLIGDSIKIADPFG